MKKYRPYYCGSEDDNYEGENISFDTSKGAWDWVAENGICEDCKKIFEENPLGSYCAGEWDVDEYDE